MKGGKLTVEEERVHLELKSKYFGIKDIKKVTSQDQEKSVRQLRYWISEGLVSSEDSGQKKKRPGWDKFNFYEFIWILLIKELKELNFSNGIIQIAANRLFSKKDKFYAMLEFEKAVLYPLFNRKHSFFVITKDGKFSVARPEDFERKMKLSKYSKFVTIDLQLLMKEFLANGEFLSYVINTKMLKPKETTALKFLQNSRNTSIIIESEDEPIIIEPNEDAICKFIETIFSVDYKTISVRL